MTGRDMQLRKSKPGIAASEREAKGAVRQTDESGERGRALPLRYHALSKWLHWTMALLAAIAWLAIEYRQGYTAQGSGASGLALDTHMLAGMTVGVLVLPRLAWMHLRPKPAPVGASGAERLLVAAAHAGLYLLMIGMPLTGYLGTGRSLNVFGLFTIPRFDETVAFQTLVADGLGQTFAEWEVPVDFLHKQLGGEIVLPVLLGLHVAAALYHHFWRRDHVLLRMLPGGSPETRFL